MKFHYVIFVCYACHLSKLSYEQEFLTRNGRAFHDTGEGDLYFSQEDYYSDDEDATAFPTASGDYGSGSGDDAETVTNPQPKTTLAPVTDTSFVSLDPEDVEIESDYVYDYVDDLFDIVVDDDSWLPDQHGWNFLTVYSRLCIMELDNSYEHVRRTRYTAEEIWALKSKCHTVWGRHYNLSDIDFDQCLSYEVQDFQLSPPRDDGRGGRWRLFLRYRCFFLTTAKIAAVLLWYCQVAFLLYDLHTERSRTVYVMWGTSVRHRKYNILTDVDFDKYYAPEYGKVQLGQLFVPEPPGVPSVFLKD
ncbi:protein E4B [Elephant endotheliotropic herpesvirus 3A]|uniref:Protein E4B n=1 Tax=Elephant endotheliotropic herpesvirus 3A TaxID=1329409 RepID=A0A866VR71_9BETA|nr:protein E4B [Elephant endotheliotropic herpesvirus 3A]QOE74365.1 protein E4B [Elephant endotheliotropic herpesvirus 3A]